MRNIGTYRLGRNLKPGELHGAMAGILPGPRFHSFQCLLARLFLGACLACLPNKRSPYDITGVSHFLAIQTLDWSTEDTNVSGRLPVSANYMHLLQTICDQIICPPSCSLRVWGLLTSSAHTTSTMLGMQ